MTWYRTGTAVFTNGNATVTGTGTAWIANASVGEGLIAPDGRIYEITAIASDTSLTISPAYLGSTASGQAYAVAPIRGRIAQLLSETSATREFSSGAFAVISDVMTISLPAGVTSATLQASAIALELVGNTPFGVTDVEFKWRRETSPGVWGDVGAAATSSPSPEIVDEGDGFPTAFPGSITCNRVATGLTAGSTQKFRLEARVSGGNVRLVTPFGVVTAAA